MKIPPKLTHHYHWNKFNLCEKGYQNLQYRKSNIKETEILNIHIYKTTADIRVVKSRHSKAQNESIRATETYKNDAFLPTPHPRVGYST